MRIDQLEIRAAGDDVLVHDLRHGKVHVLNASAGHALTLCDGAHSVDNIAAAIHTATGADLDVITRDVEALLETFATLRIVVT